MGLCSTISKHPITPQPASSQSQDGDEYSVILCRNHTCGIFIDSIYKAQLVDILPGKGYQALGMSTLQSVPYLLGPLALGILASSMYVASAFLIYLVV